MHKKIVWLSDLQRGKLIVEVWEGVLGQVELHMNACDGSKGQE
jgi:hypothetical protein